MHPQTISEIVDEIRTELSGRKAGSILQLDPLSLAIDFRSRNNLYLFVSVDPAHARIYLISRRQRQLEKQAGALSAFAQAMRSNLSGGQLTAVSRDEQERIVRLTLRSVEETGETKQRVLVAQLTGRSANLLLLDEEGTVLQTLRTLKGEGQIAGGQYAPPPSQGSISEGEPAIQKDSFPSLSAAADAFYQSLETERAFAAQAASLRARLRQEIARQKKLQKHLVSDLAEHGNPEAHKRLGDLLLANIGTAERHGTRTALVDFYAQGSARIELDIDEHTTLQDEAARYFSRYRKAKIAKQQIGLRLKESEKQLVDLELKLTQLEDVVGNRDHGALAMLLDERTPRKKTAAPAQQGQEKEKIPGARRYRSSNGYEVLVGRAAKDNDYLTFRVARPYDLWLHAADYPGSHVIVQNPKRLSIPHQTLLEAAQLAAKFSQAGKDTKVNVHYTQRKFVSRIKGAAPGLVRLASFKTIAVQPGEPIERI
jgi:predicted ribosome quality control (RQC) complex YloA/Tae2 family protein